MAEMVEPAAEMVKPTAEMVEPAAEMVEPASEMVEPVTEIMKLDLEIAQITIEKLTLQLEHEKQKNSTSTVYITQEKINHQKIHQRKSDTVNFLQMELTKKDREIKEWKEKFEKANYNEGYMKSYLEQYCGEVKYQDGAFVGINSSY